MRLSIADIRRVLALAVLLTALALSGSASAQPAADDPAAEPADDDPAAEPTGDETAIEPAAAGESGEGEAADSAGEDEGGSGAQPVATGDDVPTNLRLRRLEQQVQALKERAWRAKARVGMLKEAVLGGGVGARATITHVNKMGSSYRLVKLAYAMDGTQIFSRNDPSGALHKEKEFDVLTGPIAPGSHTISVLAVYRGHGYGVFKYLNKYNFKVRSSHTFTASEGKGTSIKVIGFERGGVTTKLEDRPAIDFKVSHSTGTGE